MNDTNDDLAALICARMCHDLISPIGAIGNGMELLGLTGVASGPEMDLIQQSVDNASARVRFFRVAFGASGDATPLPERQIGDLISAYYRDSRIQVVWSVPGAATRGNLQLALLMLLCAETALPQGGTVRVEGSEDVWVVRAEGRNTGLAPELVQRLQSKGPVETTNAAEVQFSMAAKTAQALRRPICVEADGMSLTMRA